MIVYGSSFSPFVRKVLAYLTEKGLSADLVAVGFNDPNPNFRVASPFGKMPGLSDGDFAISDSTAIITYLETKHPEPALMPATPESRARTVWYEEFADTILVATMGKIFFNRFVAPRFLGQPGDQALADAAEKDEIPPLFNYLEAIVPASGFLVDDRLTVADLAVASPFVNLAHVGVDVDGGAHPKLLAYLNGILGRPSFAPIIEQEMAFAAR